MSHPRHKNEIGNRYGRLLVLERNPALGPRREVMWDCVCDCGGRKTTMGPSLRQGRCQSCGCLWREAQKRRCQAVLSAEQKEKAKRVAEKLLAKARENMSQDWSRA